MAGDLFQDLPPPIAPQSQQILQSPVNSTTQLSSPKPPLPPPQPPAPALKSALKRSKPQPESQPEGNSHNFNCNVLVIYLRPSGCLFYFCFAIKFVILTVKMHLYVYNFVGFLFLFNSVLWVSGFILRIPRFCGSVDFL